MQLNMCKHCHKMFYHRLRTSTCEECREKDDVLFDQIEKYLREFPNSNAIQIADGLNIEAAKVLSFIDEGRLTIAKGRFEKI